MGSRTSKKSDDQADDVRERALIAFRTAFAHLADKAAPGAPTVPEKLRRGGERDRPLSLLEELEAYLFPDA